VTPQPYESGDHLSVMPQNADTIVNSFLKCFETELVSNCNTLSQPIEDGDILDQIANLPFNITALEGSAETEADVFFKTPTTLSHLLKVTVDLSLSSKDVVGLVELVKRLFDEKLQAADKATQAYLMSHEDVQEFLLVTHSILKSESGDRTQAVDDFVSAYPTIVEFLDSFKPLLLEDFFDGPPLVGVADILTILTRLQPRFYSISSSNQVSPDKVSITVGVLNVTTSKGVTIHGVCSNYVAGLQGGKDKAIVQVHKSSFRLPADPKAPLIFVGAGTGLSPMMGFLREKALEKKESGVDLGPIHLFFGCRTMSDFIYKDEIEGYEKDGLIQFHHALSRGESGSKTYVQDKIKEMGKDAAELLQNPDTHYYVCGDARMAHSCYEKCIDVLRQHIPRMSRVAAAHYLKQMQAQGRWQTDVWGIVSDYEKSKKAVMKSKQTAAKIWMQHFE